MGAGFVVLAFLGLIIISVFLYFVPLGLAISAYASGAYVSPMTLFAMRLRNVPPHSIVRPLIQAIKAGLRDIDISTLEGHFLAGGNVSQVVSALIAAQRAGITELNFDRARGIDLAGRDVLEAVRVSVNPKVISTPLVAAMAMDGIQVKATARITVKVDIAKLIGGAGEETIIARVGEGIVTTIGSAKTHKEVLENPDRISQVVLDKGLDSGTAFHIMSIDIADVDVGENIGAKLQIDQAEADKQIAQAKAEERKALAIAKEQEFAALAQEMKAKVVEQEAQVPKAIAHALMEGSIGLLDYYTLKNIQADTSMRDSFGSLGQDFQPK
ncbi:flotillin-like protein FloA [Candidatus Riflebacteria bacterium]